MSRHRPDLTADAPYHESDDSSALSDSTASSRLDEDAGLTSRPTRPPTSITGGRSPRAGGGGGRGPSGERPGSGGGAGADLTEDEVSIMVRNALAKARRAMNGGDGDPPPSSSASGGRRPSSSGPPSGALSAADSVTPTSLGGVPSSAGGPSGSTDDDGDDGGSDGVDLARRIEEEIQSARAFAERRYTAADDGPGDRRRSSADPAPVRGARSPSPASGVSVATQRRSGAGPSSFRDSARERMRGGRRDRVPSSARDSPGRAARSPRNNSSGPPNGGAEFASPGAPSSAAGSNPKTPGEDEFDSILAVSPGITPGAARAEMDAAAAAGDGSGGRDSPQDAPLDEGPSVRVKEQGPPSAPVPPALLDQLSPRSAGGGPVGLTPMGSLLSVQSGSLDGGQVMPGSRAASLSSPASANNNNASNAGGNENDGEGSNAAPAANGDAQTAAAKTTTAGGAPHSGARAGGRGHRQVLFRHPYPLPPPPPAPRPDDVVVSCNTAPEKNMNVKWVVPDADLAALIDAAGEERNLVRRSNACGAIKVLASNESNKPKLCRTQGLLDALVGAAWEDAVDSDALDARTRAVTTLLYLSEPKDNRLIVARHGGVLECLVKVIGEDTGEARWRASSALATLAKTPGNRGAMGAVEGLTTVLGGLMVVGVERGGAGSDGAAGGDGRVSDDANPQDEAAAGGGSGDGTGGNPSASESREDDSTYGHTDGTASDDQRGTFDTLDDETDEGMMRVYTGTFTEGSGTWNSYEEEDDMTYHSRSSDEGSHMDDDDASHDGGRGRGRRRRGPDGDDDDDDSYRYGMDESELDLTNTETVEEEGVEMQISSLKKLNIENASDFLARSQLSACATLTHLSKNCANARSMCRNGELLRCVMLLAGVLDNPLHTRCLEMMCNFTRFPSNNPLLASNKDAVDTLLATGRSKLAEDRMWSIRSVQNLCSDASSKVGLATEPMLGLLSTAAMRKEHDEQLAAVGALMNLSTEPGSIVPLTNTKTVVATLVHLAHSPSTPGPVRRIACDSLATIGLWLQTLASAGTVPEEIPFSPLPTHTATGWLRWDG